MLLSFLSTGPAFVTSRFEGLRKSTRNVLRKDNRLDERLWGREVTFYIAQSATLLQIQAPQLLRREVNAVEAVLGDRMRENLGL